MLVARDDVEVANPKVVIEAAQQNMTALADALMVFYMDLTLHLNEAEAADIVVASAMPIFMMQQAIDSMNAIKKIGSEVIAENKQQLILLILSIVLMVLPFVREAGGELIGGVAMIARIAVLVDVIGNAGLTAYDILQDPLSAPFAILGLIVGGFGTGLRSEKDTFGEAAKAR